MTNKFSYKDNKTNFVRVKKDRDYTTINNTCLRDDRLSWKAKGIMAYILTLSDDWIINLNELMTHSPEGEKSFRSGFNELKDLGYVKRIPIRDKNKIVGWETIIYEKPENVDNTLLAYNEHVDNVHVQKEVLRSTDNLRSTNNKNNNNTSSPKATKKEKYNSDSPYYKMAQYLYGYIKNNNPIAKEPNWQQWSDDFRKIVEIDKREKEDIKRVIDFSQTDDFWNTNILSPAKLRKQYEQLYAKSIKPKKQVSNQIYNPWEEERNGQTTNATVVFDNSSQLSIGTYED